MHKTIAAFLMSILLGAAGAFAGGLELPSLFSDHMVLQRDAELPVWGWADAGAKVTVTLAGQSKTAVADDAGAWRMTLAPRPAGGPLTMTVATGAGETVEIADVHVGEVWLCSGQSNMAWPVERVNDAEKEIAGARHPGIRMFTVARTVAPEGPRDRCQGQWKVCSPETAGAFSAAGYFFGRRLHKELDVPVGLINSSWGATAIEPWTSRPALQAYRPTAEAIKRWAQRAEAWDDSAAKAKYKEQLDQWQEKAKAAGEAGTKPPRRPQRPTAPLQDKNHPATLYNGMIAPLVPYAIRGAIWYQGESNAGRAAQYVHLQPAMIRDWRKAWGRGAFPFYFVQLANFDTGALWPGSNWGPLRAAQTASLDAVDAAGMAVTLDIGDPKDIHPRNKQDVGERLARWALAKDYGKDIVFSGPLYRSMSVEGGTVRLTFDCADGLTTSDGKPLGGFVIAGADGEFVDAEAVIDGETVVVSSPKVAAPVAVRYAWSSLAEGCNLVNGAGLPAGTFRTDPWESEAAGK